MDAVDHIPETNTIIKLVIYQGVIPQNPRNNRNGRSPHHNPSLTLRIIAIWSSQRRSEYHEDIAEESSRRSKLQDRVERCKWIDMEIE